jgi:hypothetical protein
MCCPITKVLRSCNEDINNGHYWTLDADGNKVGDMEQGDRREAVFYAFIKMITIFKILIYT